MRFAKYELKYLLKDEIYLILHSEMETSYPDPSERGFRQQFAQHKIWVIKSFPSSKFIKGRANTDAKHSNAIRQDFDSR
jgi:hypothetical protein